MGGITRVVLYKHGVGHFERVEEERIHGKSNVEELIPNVEKQGVPLTRESYEGAVGTTPRGHIIYEGPRGGRYHYSRSGKKVYERRRR